MPKNRRITEEMVLNAAAEIVRAEGTEALNVRSLAKALDCSTQPIYSIFKNMEGLWRALMGEAKAKYRKHIDDFLRQGGRSNYEAYGMGFVSFAKEEQGLFRYLFLSGKGTPDPFLDDIEGEMMTLYHMPEETAAAFHADMAVFSFGLAVLVNKQADALSEEQIAEAFKRQFYALYAFYFPNRERFWEKA